MVSAETEHSDSSRVVRQARVVAAAVLAAGAQPGGGRVLAIDGRAGAGKSTLAADVVRQLRAAGTAVELVAMEDLYEGWEGLDDSLPRRVREQVVEPFAMGRRSSWQRYDWAAERFGSWAETSAADVLVLEGCGSGAAELASCTSLLVWVELPAGERHARAIARDGEVFATRWDAWASLEDAYLLSNRPRERADLEI